ncbi:MAG: hypothetical protein HC905_21015 [Bacteroidales bacterium]|nr:hypothetical protein [Bacteroidales bacterium]
MGWNWITHLANYCKLTVISEKSFQQEIEKSLPELKLTHQPVFHYLDIGERAIKLFWKQGDWRFYKFYHAWQKQALDLARQLYASSRFHLTHQLNLIGYREPGYLWKLPLPHIWGPINGYQQMPWNYLRFLDLTGAFYYFSRNMVNLLQMYGSMRVHTAVRNTETIVCATMDDYHAIKKYMVLVPKY